MTRILIVEDEESYREPLVYQLTREGYDVSAAATGEDGLELFTQGGVDLVLLDLMLPGLDGTALCRRIREQSRVPIIMLDRQKRGNRQGGRSGDRCGRLCDQAVLLPRTAGPRPRGIAPQSDGRRIRQRLR